ncbi:hypothetical protein SAMN04515648_1914 [Phyllobacterium sp. CL33Tsu]|nr:hypothetical protein SAMN04515648_1914 [Phyllobacterium sp. CL33Tsu]
MAEADCPRAEPPAIDEMRDKFYEDATKLYACRSCSH